MKKIVLIIVLFFILLNKVNASFIVFDQQNYNTLYGENIHEKRLIASITKVMTAYIVLNNINNLNELVTIGDEIDKAHGSSIYLKKGEEIRVIDLLYGMMLRSGNDAATALAVYTSGSLEDFVKLMNKEVKNMGLKDTVFQNPTGLDDDNTYNLSSAYDMAYITSKAMKNKVFRKIFKTKKHSVKTNLNMHVWYNKNKALYMDKSITGGKTGYTKKAKRTLITTSSKNNIDLVIVSLGMSDDFDFHVNSHKYVFKNYNNYLILNKTNLNVDKKYYKNDKLYLKDNYHLVLKKSELKNIRIVYELYKNKDFHDNDIVGKTVIYNKENLIYDAPIYVKVNKGLIK